MKQAGSNGFEPAKTWVAEIEKHMATLATYTGEHMARCQKVREMIADCYDRAKDAGVPRKELKAVIKVRGLEKKIAAAREELDDGGETFDMIRHALGDLAELPLGKAALDRSAAVDSLTDDEFDAADPNKLAADANASKIAEGIKPLPH